MLYQRFRIKKDEKEKLLKEINELRENLIDQDSKMKIFEDEKKQERDMLQE